MIATIEIGRENRRGAKLEHIFYMAMKIVRLRIAHGLYETFWQTASITRENLLNDAFWERCMDHNHPFLESEHIDTL